MKFSDMKKTLDIFENYNIEDCWFEYDHDMIFGPSLVTEFTKEDQKKLREIGWRPSTEFDCWYY